MNFVSYSQVAEFFRGKRIAIVGSGPGSLDNEPGFVDGHDVVCRVNNFKCGPAQGERVDVHYSFYGTSINTRSEDLIERGCKLVICKLPNSQPIESEWHRKNGKLVGIDYTYIYRARANWWPCPVFIPDDARFLAKFELLGKHQPTTGFAAIMDVLEAEPAEVYLTGFDFFTSGTHNVNEPWVRKNEDDPICHRPDLEAIWIRENASTYPLKFDRRLAQALSSV